MPRLSPAQLRLRRTTLGSSDAPRLFNGQAMALWLEKMGLSEPTEETFQQDFGHRIEPVVAKLYEDRLRSDAEAMGLEVARLRLRANRKTHQNPLARWQACTPDYFVHDGTDADRVWLLEVKNRNEYTRKGWGEEGTDQVPRDILLQCLWQLQVTGLHRCDVAVLFGNSSLQVYTIQIRDHQTLIEEANRRAMRLRELVRTETPPDLDGSEAWSDYLAHLYPVAADDVYLEADDHAEQLLAALAQASVAAKQSEAAYLTAKLEVQVLVGSHRGLTGHNGKVTRGGRCPTRRGSP